MSDDYALMDALGEADGADEWDEIDELGMDQHPDDILEDVLERCEACGSQYTDLEIHKADCPNRELMWLRDISPGATSLDTVIRDMEATAQWLRAASDMGWTLEQPETDGMIALWLKSGTPFERGEDGFLVKEEQKPLPS